MPTHIQVKKATETLRAEFKHLTDAELQRAISRAINYSLARTRTRISKDIREVFNLTAGDIGNKTQLQRARPVYFKQVGYILADTAPLNITRFNPKAINNNVITKLIGGRRKGAFASSKTKNPGSGLFVEIYKGKEEVIKSAFLMLHGSGVSVMARGSNTRGKFDFGKPRLPIDGVTSKSIYTSILNPEVERKYGSFAEKAYSDRLVHEIMEGVKHWR